MPLSTNEHHRIFVMLFGTLDFDGRVKRMIEILQKIGPVTLIDITNTRNTGLAPVEGVDRHCVELPP